MKQVAVIIPVHKPKPNNFEIISLRQVIKILYKYDFKIVTYKELDTSFYDQCLQEGKINYQYEYFDASFFKDIQGYNQLMLSIDFYKRFRDYKFILIYQLDAYVFRDELEYWCEQDYDFIGAPLPVLSIKDYKLNQTRDPVYVGNGGFSLRKIESVIEFLSFKRPIIKPKVIFQYYKKHSKNILKCYLITIIKSLGYKNNIRYFVKSGVNEDQIFCLIVDELWINKNLQNDESFLFLKKPTINEAVKFAFELYPSTLFEFNNENLPFGCHAWDKYEYNTFWQKYILLT